MIKYLEIPKICPYCNTKLIIKQENNSKIYISNGIGSNHGLRLMNKPSINVYRLYNK